MNRLLSRANKRVSLGNAATLLIVVALLSQILGFFRNRLISTNIAQLHPGSTDAFFAAFEIPDFFFLTIAAGALGVAFMPVLADRLEKFDKEAVWELTSSLLNLLTIIMLVASVFIFIFARPLIHYVVAPQLAPVNLDKATVIMRLVALNPLLFTVSGIITSMEQTFGRFFFYALAPLFYNMSIIVSLYVFKSNIGVVGLGIGALVGACLQLLVACLGLIGLGFKWRPKINFRSSDFNIVAHNLPARSIDQGIDSINSIVEVNRATKLGEGVVTNYTFATTLMNVPIMLFGTSIATAAFPRLNERLAQNRPDLFHKDFFRIMQTMIWIAMPVVVVSYFGRGYLARLLYGDNAPTVSLIFGYLVVAIFFRIMYSIVSRFYYAQKDTRTPLFVSLFAIALNIFLAFTLARPQPLGYGIAGLALAQSIVAVVEVALLILIMLSRDPYLFNKDFWNACVRIVSVTGFSALAGYVMVRLLPLRLTDRGFVTLGFKIGLIGGVTILVHVAISALFGLEEAQIAIRKVTRLLLKPIRIQ